jgi:nucleoside-diphosphate-sugar epimerase
MRVLVTGNRGYIGSVLCGELFKEGFEVVGLDANFYNNCNFYKLNYSIPQITKDVRNITKEETAGFEAVIHLAALSNDPIGELSPQLTQDINCQASINLAKLAKENGVKRFIFSSSCSIYGQSGANFIDESGEPNPLTEYAKSKVKAEEGISKLADNNFSPVFLRNATVYGVSPMLRVDLVLNNLVGWAYTTGKIKIMSDGTPWRPLIHIQDICQAFIVSLKAPKNLVHNEVFNIGKNSENYQIKDIADIIKEVLPESKIEYTGEHGADSRTYKVDFTKAENTLGEYFRPQRNIKQGVKELVGAYKQANFKFEDFQSYKFTRLKKIKMILNTGQFDASLFWKEDTLR